MSIKLNSLSDNMQSFRYANTITNGNFVNTGNWYTNRGTLTVSNNIGILTGDGTNSKVRLGQGIAANNGKKIYFNLRARVTNSICTSILIETYIAPNFTTYTSKNSPVQNEWYTLSGVVTTLASYEFYINHLYTTGSNANGKVMEVDKVLVIDLTTLYGTGNEPTAADCLKIFNFVETTKQPSLSKSLSA